MQLEQFYQTCSRVFNLDYINQHVKHNPISLDNYYFGPSDLYGHQKLHYMIKNRDGRKLYTDSLYKNIPEIEHFVLTCETYLEKTELANLVEDRYAYLTIDTRAVNAGESQRDPGWHIDCVQGDEVPVKKPGNIAFSWCDSVPTEYVDQSLSTEGCGLSTHNVFDFLGKQVKQSNIKSIDTETITLMNTYCVHRATVSDIDTTRRFVRISYTHCPITNKRMHVNNDIEYDYPIHSTDGVIPNHLI